MERDRRALHIKLNKLIQYLAKELTGVYFSAPIKLCDLKDFTTGRRNLCNHVSPGSVIIAYNNEIRIKNIITIVSDSPKVRIVRYENGWMSPVSAEAVCTFSLQRFCEIHVKIDLQPF